MADYVTAWRKANTGESYKYWLEQRIETLEAAAMLYSKTGHAPDCIINVTSAFEMSDVCDCGYDELKALLPGRGE